MIRWLKERRHPRFIWCLRDLLQFEPSIGKLPQMIGQSEWVITEFRQRWPYSTLEGSGSGNTNDYDATDFLRSLISRMADDTSVEGSEAVARMVAGPTDRYSELIRHMAAERRQKRTEEDFSVIASGDLGGCSKMGPQAMLRISRRWYPRVRDLAQDRLLLTLTDTDQTSRFLLLCEALESTREHLAITAFEQIFRERGLPVGIRSGNGVPFASPKAIFNLSKLAVLWFRLGIAIERTKPGHPA